MRQNPILDMRRSLRRTLGEEGVVIIAVLWMTALIMWFALQISLESRLKGEEQVHHLRRSQALHLAIGGCYEALARMGQTSPDVFARDRDKVSWLPDGRPNVVQYATGEAVVYIESEKDKINVNGAPPDVLAEVLEKAGLQEGDAAQLADRILDFIDPDDIPRLRGGEREWYEQQGLIRGPFNGPLTSLEQLLLIPGVTQQLFYGYGIPRSEDPRGDSKERPPLMPQKDSLFEMLTIHGSNTALQSFEDEDFIEKIYTWESGEVYRILSWGVSASGPPGVLLCLIVRFAPETERGFEVLHRKVL